MITLTLENIKDILQNKLTGRTITDERLYDIIAYSIDIVASDSRQFKKKQVIFDSSGIYRGMSDIRIIRIDPVLSPQVSFNEIYVKTFNPKYNSVDFTYDAGIIHAPELVDKTALLTYLPLFTGTESLFNNFGQLQTNFSISMTKFEFDLLLLHTEAHAIEYITQNQTSGGAGSTDTTIGTSGTSSERSVQFGDFRITEKADDTSRTTTTNRQTTTETVVDDLASYLLDRYDQMIQRIAPRGMTASR